MATRLAPELARARVAVLGAFVVTGLAAGSWASRIPAVRAELSLSEGALGTALLGLSFGAVTGAWVGGLLERRTGVRPVVLGAWLALAATLPLPALASSRGWLLVALLAFGLAIGVLDVSMNAAAVIVEERAGRPVLSGLHAGWSGGLLVGALLGSAAVALDVGPEVHLALVGVLVLVLLALARPHVPSGRSGGAEAGERPTLAPAARRRLLAAAAICGCIFLAEGAAIDWAGVLVEDMGGSALLASLAVTGVSAGGLIGRLLGDGLVLRLGAPTLVRSGALLSTLALAALLALGRPLSAPLLIAVVGFGVAPAVPLAFGAAGRLAGGRGIALATTAGYGAYLAGPGVIGWIADAVGLRWAMALPVVLVAGVAGLASSLAGAAADHEHEPTPLGVVG